MPQFIFTWTIIFSLFPFEPSNSKYFHVFFACPVINVYILCTVTCMCLEVTLRVYFILRMSYIRLVKKSHRIQLLLPVCCHLWNVNGTDNEYRGCMHFSGQVSIKLTLGRRDGLLVSDTTSTSFKWVDVRKILIDPEIFVSQRNFYVDFNSLYQNFRHLKLIQSYTSNCVIGTYSQLIFFTAN